MYRLRPEDSKGISIGMGGHGVKAKLSIDSLNCESFTFSGMPLSKFSCVDVAIGDREYELSREGKRDVIANGSRFKTYETTPKLLIHF